MKGFSCSPKTMLKIGAVIAVPLVAGFIVFSQFRPVIVGFLPFALFALCPLGMLFGIRGMTGGKDNQPCSVCGHNHAEKTKHIKKNGS